LKDTISQKLLIPVRKPGYVASNINNNGFNRLGLNWIMLDSNEIVRSTIRATPLHFQEMLESLCTMPVEDANNNQLDSNSLSL
jgi:hypothetical protein